MSTQKKVAVITGAGSGIGRATALAFLEDGWHVTVAGRRKEALEETLQIGSAGERGLAVPTDVGNPQSVSALFGQVKDKFGRVDVLFNNAGQNVPGVPFEDLPYEKWQSVVDANFTGGFLCAQAAYRIMKDQDPRGGRIINNGSISAHAPRPNSVAYTSTKHAVTGLTKSTSLDGRKYDIACGQIDIGNARTEFAERLPRGPAAEPLMDVEHVGRAVLHMANLPLDANVQFMTIMATKMPFIGRG